MEAGSESFVRSALSAADPSRLKTVDDLKEMIEEIGFLPLFKNEIDGFSVEEHTAGEHWWGEDPAIDPWEWRAVIAKEGNLVYGKFFHNRAGFLSRQWLPHFVNYRRDGYDFDSLYEDGKAALRCKKIMDLFQEADQLPSNRIKEMAGFSKGGEKNFNGTMTRLQMQTYLIVSDFTRKRNKKGEEYGWSVAAYTTPEKFFGEDLVKSSYSVRPEESGELIFNHIMNLYKTSDKKDVRKVLK